ncbi:hypothetical protein EJ02DRAFT_248379 [Clathrospora elynae]|uniref:Uncharacterized protein n=1 Tax=Clathrospora elynae TaxID=706981 RepID=A0A6A5T3I6_9PLEO|nr:hypothetical protein EJ02DRAFT_248379 [Clathrospora elynae]
MTNLNKMKQAIVILGEQNTASMPLARDSRIELDTSRFITTIATNHNPAGEPSHPHSSAQTAFALNKVCRQIYNETKHLLSASYSLDSFLCYLLDSPEICTITEVRMLMQFRNRKDHRASCRSPSAALSRYVACLARPGGGWSVWWLNRMMRVGI